jgi:hypothetical protein
MNPLPLEAQVNATGRLSGTPQAGVETLADDIRTKVERRIDRWDR